jgi:hypothetical protein
MIQVNNGVNDFLLEDLDTIPKIINFTWKDKNIKDNNHPMITNGLRKMIDLNPEWDVVISDDEDVEDYLKENLSSKDYNDIKYKHVVEKTDLWRLIKLYNEGGVYHDLDRYCNISFDDFITEDIKFILPTHEDFGFAHCLMGTAPKNPIFKQAIKDNIEERTQLGNQSLNYEDTKNKILILGSITWSKTVFNTLFDFTGYDRKKEGNGLNWRMMEDDIRSALYECKHTTTKKEIPWCFTSTFCISGGNLDGYDLDPDLLLKEEPITYYNQELFYQYRKEFYKNFDTHHWSDLTKHWIYEQQ